jgi:hypothetical protein
MKGRFGEFGIARNGINRRAAQVLRGADMYEAKGHAKADGLGYRPGGGVKCGLGAVDSNNHRSALLRHGHCRALDRFAELFLPTEKRFASRVSLAVRAR